MRNDREEMNLKLFKKKIEINNNNNMIVTQSPNMNVTQRNNDKASAAYLFLFGIVVK